MKNILIIALISLLFIPGCYTQLGGYDNYDEEYRQYGYNENYDSDYVDENESDSSYYYEDSEDNYYEEDPNYDGTQSPYLGKIVYTPVYIYPYTTFIAINYWDYWWSYPHYYYYGYHHPYYHDWYYNYPYYNNSYSGPVTKTRSNSGYLGKIRINTGERNSNTRYTDRDRPGRNTKIGDRDIIKNNRAGLRTEEISTVRNGRITTERQGRISSDNNERRNVETLRDASRRSYSERKPEINKKDGNNEVQRREVRRTYKYNNSSGEKPSRSTKYEYYKPNSNNSGSSSGYNRSSSRSSSAPANRSSNSGSYTPPSSSGSSSRSTAPSSSSSSSRGNSGNSGSRNSGSRSGR